MFDLDHWQEIWAALSKNRLRTFLTAFGVFWGILLLVLLLGSGNGLANGVNAGFSGMATNSVFVWAMRTSKPYAGLPAGRRIEFDDADWRAIESQMTEVETVAPRLQLGGWRGGARVSRGQHSGSYSVTGEVPAIQRVQSLVVTRGRFVNDLDVERRRKVALIGERVREVLFDKDEDPVGGAIEVNGVQFKVIGTFKSRQSGRDADQVAESVIVPFTAFQQAFNAVGRVHWFALVGKDGVSAAELEKKTLALLKGRHKVAPDDRRGIGSFNLQEEFDKVQGLFTGIRMLMWIVGLGTLAAGAIGVSNILLIVVRERTKELGIRRAVGATPWKVRAQILVEAVLLTSVSGLTGLMVGVALLEGIAHLVPSTGADGEATMFQAPGIDLPAAAFAIGVLVVAGAIAGFLPAQRAVSVSPVEALRAD